MSVLHPLPPLPSSVEEPSYFYEGCCPETGLWIRLPRTARSEHLARELMGEFARVSPSPSEGKMFGVLVVETTLGSLGYLKAFSGLLEGQSFVSGWVPPLPGHEEIALDEEKTLAQLGAMKAELIRLSEATAWAQLEEAQASFDAVYAVFCERQRVAKEQRRARRETLEATLEGEALRHALGPLNEESRQHKRERRDIRQAHRDRCAGLRAEVGFLRSEIERIKQERKAVSRQLQAQMHSVYSLTNFAGETRPLSKLGRDGNLPTGTGDCCAPKLLYYAATRGLKPLGMAEFWWGESRDEGRREGEFYPACEARCQPIMGFLLSGLPAEARAPALSDQRLGLSVIYEDESMLVIDKPGGLLSVPGRTSEAQDSAISRARHLFPDIMGPAMVHRLDMETSGLLVIARNPESQRELSRQFKEREIQKRYEAILCGEVEADEGEIALALAPKFEGSNEQWVDFAHGKPSVTRFQVLEREGGRTRVEFSPVTGRTHQLRVHAAHPEGLNAPILGDRLYHPQADGERLHLHARSLEFHHPKGGQLLVLSCPVPF